MTSNSEFHTAAAQNSPAEQGDALGPVGRHGQGIESETLVPGCHRQQCHLDPAYSQQGDALERRFRFLMHYLDFHSGLDDAVQQLPIDEELLEFLTRDRIFQEMHRAIEVWLVTAYNDRTGLYADPAARAQSALPRHYAREEPVVRFVGKPKTLIQDGNRTVMSRVVDLEAMGLRGHGPRS